MIGEYTKGDFNTNEFANLTFKKRVEYCQQHFGEPIGVGSSRIVFMVEPYKKVIKLAKNKRGLAQNKVECETSSMYPFQDMYPAVYEYDKENYSYIISEYAERVNQVMFKKYFGYTYKYFKEFCYGAECEYLVHPILDYKLTDKDLDLMEKEHSGTLSSFYTFITYTHPYTLREIISLRNLGVVFRNKKPKLVICDAGWDEEVHKLYENVEDTGTVTLWHGLRNENLDYVLCMEELTPHMCAEGVKGLWFSIKCENDYPSGYQCLISIEVPKSEIGKWYSKKFTIMNETHIFTEQPVNINDYNFKVHKINGFPIDEERIELWRNMMDAHPGEFQETMHKMFPYDSLYYYVLDKILE